MKKVIGILGGMGPEATLTLFQKILQYTSASKDQDHIPLLIDNNVLIPDRTTYILKGGENPLPLLISSAKRLEKMGAETIAMPCNTAHYFYNEIKEQINIPLINMIEETAHYVTTRNLESSSVVLFATLGTYKSEIYDVVFKEKGIIMTSLQEENKNYLYDIIYQVKRGNKEHKQKEMIALLKEIKNKGYNTIVLGCTELPLYFDQLSRREDIKKLGLEVIDTLDLLARKVVEIASV